MINQNFRIFLRIFHFTKKTRAFEFKAYFLVRLFMISPLVFKDWIWIYEVLEIKSKDYTNRKFVLIEFCQRPHSLFLKGNKLPVINCRCVFPSNLFDRLFSIIQVCQDDKCVHLLCILHFCTVIIPSSVMIFRGSDPSTWSIFLIQFIDFAVQEIPSCADTQNAKLVGKH